jgi:DNA-directed RNA polymerase subunit H (RpoH/RPB5)
MNHEKVNQCIESLCTCGCESVHAVITALEQGVYIPETAGLSQEEKKAVLNELKSVMEVYSCRHPSPPREIPTSRASDPQIRKNTG